MTEFDHASNDSDTDDPKNIIDAASCLDYLKRREVFLYKMMNDPSHKAMLYFLEVLMNAENSITVDQLAARFSHKTFSPEMRDACGGGSSEGLKEFLERYPSLFNVRSNGQVSSVAIELPGLGSFQGSLLDGMDAYSISNSSLKEECLESCSGKTNKHSSNRGYTFSRRTTELFMNDSSANNRFKSTSDLSLNSLKSANSSNSSSESPSFGCLNATQSSGCRIRERPIGTERVESCCVVNSTNSNPYRRTSNPSVLNWSRPSGVYQPPKLKELTKQMYVKKPVCDVCSSKNVPMNSHVSGSTCVHCPLISLTCHHHCPSVSHHHLAPCCHYTTNSLNANAHCHAYCNPPNLTNAPVNTIRPSNSQFDYCSLPSMEKLMLETEAVKFFQQKLLKKEERWVPIKSLAGNLSQASFQIRAMVGPQLEFRRFLLEHPQVFEVQGELVSVRNLFHGLPTQRKPRDRFFSSHFSQSSTNLAATNNMGKVGMIAKPTRPKSMIFTQYSNSTTPTSAFGNTAGSTHRKTENRRSTHFAETFVPTSYGDSLRGPSISGSTSSIPTTPTGINQTCRVANVVDNHLNLKQTSENINTSAAVETELATNGSMTLSTELEITTATSFVGSSQTLASLSIDMSADEYRAVMFLRRVLGKKGCIPGKQGIPLNNLMQFISTKAPETVQLTIGWTKVELEEFINQHTLFFEIFKNPLTDESNTKSGIQLASDLITGSSTKYVGNKRLERMINIIITGSNSNESTARTLTNHCGRIFHVAKLWGIIDLGKHEHVFFDKSIFKHLDDLQKHFTVNELLYFNAIQAPKGSRAKWRATQVWKECDQEYMKRMENNPPVAHLNLFQTKKSESRTSNDLCTSTPKSNVGQEMTSYYTENAFNEDTETDEDLELDSDRYAIEPSVADDEDNDLINPSDNEFALADDDLEEDRLISAMARAEGLNLASDIKFMADEDDDELNNLSLKTDSIKRENANGMHGEKAGNNDSIVTSTSCNPSVAFRNNNSTYNRNSYDRIEQKHFRNRPQNLVTSSTGCNDQRDNVLIHDKLNASKRSSEINSNSIAVQTLSTGDIMATLLYHDLSKQ